MKELKQAESRKTTRPHYVFRDLSGNPISKAEAKAMITATWGDVSQPKERTGNGLEDVGEPAFKPVP